MHHNVGSVGSVALFIVVATGFGQPELETTQQVPAANPQAPALWYNATLPVEGGVRLICPDQDNVIHIEAAIVEANHDAGGCSEDISFKIAQTCEGLLAECQTPDPLGILSASCPWAQLPDAVISVNFRCIDASQPNTSDPTFDPAYEPAAFSNYSIYNMCPSEEVAYYIAGGRPFYVSDGKMGSDMSYPDGVKCQCGLLKLPRNLSSSTAASDTEGIDLTVLYMEMDPSYAIKRTCEYDRLRIETPDGNRTDLCGNMENDLVRLKSDLIYLQLTTDFGNLPSVKSNVGLWLEFAPTSAGYAMHCKAAVVYTPPTLPPTGSASQTQSTIDYVEYYFGNLSSLSSLSPSSETPVAALLTADQSRTPHYIATEPQTTSATPSLGSRYIVAMVSGIGCSLIMVVVFIIIVVKLGCRRTQRTKKGFLVVNYKIEHKMVHSDSYAALTEKEVELLDGGAVKSDELTSMSSEGYVSASTADLSLV